MHNQDYLETPDIREKINVVFGDNAESARKLLRQEILKHEYLNHPRILRCIIYLCETKFATLQKNIDYAIADRRDVMLWAEYENLKDGQALKRIRDFNKSFEDCEKNVQE